MRETGKLPLLFVLWGSMLVFMGCQTASPVITPRNADAMMLNFDQGKVYEVRADPQNGFHFDYFLFIPANVKKSDVPYLLVEPNNTGKASDDHSVHEKHARRMVSGGPANRIGRALGTAVLVPTFDRPRRDWKMYTHALDSETLQCREGILARIDLQLIAMIRHARKFLAGQGVMLEKRVLLHGFSASGNFTNRFAALHPRIVKAVVSGGVNGMPILPVTRMGGRTLPFHVGVADLDKVAGITFDMKAYRRVAQYIYMGSLDDRDTLPYNDAYNQNEREITEAVLGMDMHERWEASKRVYAQRRVPAQFVMYNGIGHDIPKAVEHDIIRFFRSNTGEKIRHITPCEHPMERNSGN